MRVTTALTLLLVASQFSPLGAQVIRGKLIEDGSDRHIADGTIHLLDASGTTVDLTVTDPVGAFRLVAPGPGRYRLEGTRIGYATAVTREIDLEKGDTVEVTFRLSPKGIPLDPITVRASNGKERGRDAFARRCALGKGTCLTSDSIQKLNPVYPSDVFRTVPGIYVDYARGPQGRVMTLKGWGCFVVFYNRSITPLEFTSRRSNQLRSGPRNLLTQRFADRLRNNTEDFTRAGESLGFRLDDLIADDIRGVEVYPASADVPKELKNGLYGDRLWPQGQLGSCGAAIIWDRAGW
jgi:hypothetical protein